MVGIVLDREINSGLRGLLEELSKKIKIFGDTYATIFNQQEIADEIGISVRTVYRQVETLQNLGAIEVETRRGRNGGTVIVFNREYVSFESHEDNPITGKTKTAKELRDKYYPNKGTYRPDDRTPEEKERDRIRAKRLNSIHDKMNANIRYKGFPDKEFFEMSQEPKETFKAYMLSRAYNAMLITRLEMWKNEAERAGNEVEFDRARKTYLKYRNYDVLPHEFMGTNTFNSFKSLRDVLDERGYDVIEYMSNAFDTFIYLLKQGRNARPPYVNTLYNGKTLERFENQVEWKRKFEREHPYYAKPGQVNIIGDSYPITQIIGRAYRHPMEESMDMQDIIDAHLSNIDRTPTEMAKRNYYNKIVREINGSDYEEEVKQQAINFVNEKISVQLIPNMPEADYIIANLRKIVHGDDIRDTTGEVRSREWYADRGSIEQTAAETRLTNKLKVKRGYLIDFSVNGGSTFEGVWRVIENSSTYMWDMNRIKPLLEDLKDLIPYTELGDIDLEQVVEKTTPTESLSAQAKLEAVFKEIKTDRDSKYLEETLDNTSKMWYNVVEDVIGNSLRDGRSITKETIRR